MHARVCVCGYLEVTSPRGLEGNAKSASSTTLAALTVIVMTEVNGTNTVVN